MNFKQEEYRARRLALAQSMDADSIAVIPAATERVRNGDADYRFRQNSDFYYLTGFEEPDAVLLVTGGKGSQSILFNRPRHFEQELWTGKRLGQEGAVHVLGMDDAYSIDELDARLVDYFSGQQAIYTLIGQHATVEHRLLSAWKKVKGQARRGIKAPQQFCDLAPRLGELRLIKRPDELECMRTAATVTVAAHQRAMKAVRHARYEYELEAELLHEMIRNGCRNVAYDSIVAGGENACTLHYTANDQALHPKGLVLIDAGSEWLNYASDVTRTFPVSGYFTSEQRDIYTLVLQAQQAGIACVRPGCRWDTIQSTMVKILTQGLVDLGLLKGDVSDLIEAEAYKPYYMHNSGHWLGLDVHDVGAYKVDGQWRVLQPNMVLTVEPGIYIHPGLSQVDERWWGIGVRIEDDILVTEHGFDNLTEALVVELDDVEAWVRD